MLSNVSLDPREGIVLKESTEVMGRSVWHAECFTFCNSVNSYYSQAMILLLGVPEG